MSWYRRLVFFKEKLVLHSTTILTYFQFSGNAYAFLAMYQTTREIEYLIKAEKFTEFMFDYNEQLARNPDRPYSLFEGIAGTAYFLDDIGFDPMRAKFPALYV